MDTTAVHPDDVPALEESTALGVRDWASGARPVLGTLAASTLLVVVCGLFVIDAGSFGRRHDVGQRQPVQMLPTQLRHDQAQAPARAQSTTGRAHATRRSHLPAVDKPVRTVHVDQAPGAGSAGTPTPGGDAAKPAPNQAPQRKALLLREWRGFSYDEIGSELGLSQAATEALLFRARQNVAQRLEGRISVKTLNGLPFLTFVRNLFQTGTAKLVAVAVGTTLTIASVPAADVGSKHVAKPPARLGSTPSVGRHTTQATKRTPVKPQAQATHRRAGVAPIHSEPAIGDAAAQTPTGDAAIPAVSPSPTVHADTPQPGTTTPTVEVSSTDVGAILPLPVTPSTPSLPLPTPSIVAPALPVVTVPEVSVPDLPLPQGP